jgi:methionyl-tRNA formyltransferase
MSNLELESVINQALIADNEKRKIISVGESRWGELIIPAKNENPGKNKKGLRVVVFGSFLFGYILFETLKECEKRFPDRLNIVGLVTDDPVNPDAKISIKKRIWRLFDSDKKLQIEKIMIESALSFGVPCYTGEVKIDYFKHLLKIWNPDAMIVFVFGQILDAPIINYPPYGIYNFHPSDLADHHGAGTQPFEDLITRKADTTKITIHMITEQIDLGPIVGQSTPIRVKMENGEMPDNTFVIDDKIMVGIGNMAAALISELILRKEKNQIGPVNKLNFEEIFSESFKAKLMEPIKTNIPEETIPELDKDLTFII